MKNILVFVLLLCAFLNIHAQVPQKFSYQTIVRNTSNNILTNQTIGLRVRILLGSASGSIVYAEYHNPTSNSNGLVNLEIGSGSVLNGNFSTINWASGLYYIRIDVDPNGGTNYTINGTSQLLSVPYALYAGSSGSANTILNGTSNPLNSVGNNGDFYLNTATSTLFGPKVSGAWPLSGTLLIGATGANGTNGTNGINGNTILNGTANPTAGQGVNGDFYLNNTTKVLFGPKAAGAWPPSGITLIGPTGAAGTNGTNGTDGNTVLNGNSNPTAGQGNNGDFFLNTVSYTLFGPKASGVWPSTGISLVGPQGASGSSTIVARNGITKTGDTLDFGGRMMKSTSLSQDGFPFQIKEIDSSSTVLEISQTAFSPLVNLSSTASTQTFTSIASTKLHSIKIRVTATSGSSITLAIKNNGGTTLYSGTQTFGALFDNWQTFNINTNIVQQVGDVYTVSVTGTAGTTWYYSSGNPYTGGQSSVNPNRDFAFETIVFTDVPVLFLTNKKVGIGNSSPNADLDVTGKIRATDFQLTTGAAANRVLVSDANGNGIWTSLSAQYSTNLNSAYNYGGAGNGRIISANAGPVEIEGSDGLLIRKLGFSTTPFVISGAGERMFYCPEVSAFRCGEVSGSNWDLDSLGTYSAAFGLNTKATGNQSFAIGQNSIASGPTSLAVGTGSQASGTSSFAQGGGSKAMGINSSSFGFATTAAATYSFATGKNSKANGGSSAVFGDQTISNGFASVVVGSYNDTVIAAQPTADNAETPVFIVGNGNSSIRKNAFLVRKDGRVGIGTSMPVAQLHIADSSVVFTGSGGLYSTALQTPVNGAGRRMLWFTARAAFRSGEVSGDNWNKDSIGNYSGAIGYNAKAKGLSSFSAGDSCAANGSSAIALGNKTLASGTNAFASGNRTQATASNSIAMGNSSIANAINSAALGENNRASGTDATAFGEACIANAYASFVVGRFNDSIVAPETAQQTTSPVFVVGIGSTNVNRGNAFIVRRDGRVGIGTNVPLNQLELSTNSAAKPSSSSWTISSDARLKTVDGNYTKGLADILKLNTIRYHYKEGNARNLPTNETGFGFVAQELQQVFPEAVKENEDGYLSVDMHPVLVAYINAFKDQQEQLDEMKKLIQELQQEIKLLKK